MKKIGLGMMLLVFLFNIDAQESKTYAVVIGISTYQEIPSLDYAHRDAQAFADFLHSPNGGSVPLENITLLLNEQATIAAISLAFEKIIDATNKNDTVYIYFSGHGDVDGNLAHDPGFLLAYDTPKGHYLKNAIEIDGFNNYIVNTLSVKKEATVIVITDACHSGKLLHTDSKSTLLAAEQLRKIKNNETRISSCAPGELSQEDERWGNGRGVFSYYLIKGLNGAARTSHNGMVSVQAIGDYLKESMGKDEILLQKKQPQNPLVSGLPGFNLSKVVQMINEAVTNSNPVNVQTAGPLSKPVATIFFEIMEFFPVENMFNYFQLEAIPPDEISNYCINKVLDTIEKLKKNNTRSLFIMKGKIFLTFSLNDFDSTTANRLKNTLKENPYLNKQFRRKLAQLFSDKVQSAINAYLKGDAAELEKRQYYNVDQNSYAAFPKMLSVARKLLKEKDGKPTELEKQLEFKEYYFSGIVERLQLPLNNHQKPVLQKAIAYQLKALAIEEDADYIQNELGVLHFYNKEYDKAKTCFNKAKELNPDWALPLSNLAAVYQATLKTDSGMLYAEKARTMQPGLQGGYINQGLLYEQKNNLLAAEELFQKSIQLNSRYYVPFERLGYIYLKTANFAKADSFLFEAEERKKGYKFLLPSHVATPEFKITEPETNCDFIGKNIIPGPTDVLSNMVLGLEWLIVNNYNGDYVKAEKYFRAAIQINPANHLATHYLGKALLFQKRWQEAEINFKKARKYFVSNADYDRYLVQQILKEKNPDANCILKKIKENYYSAAGDYFCLGDTYIYWGHFQDAENEFKKAISANRLSRNGYYKLWTLLLAQGKYTDAEPVFWDFYYATKNSNEQLGKQYLAFFYNKVVRKFPDNAVWLYKAGSFYYNELKQNSQAYETERNAYKRNIEVKEFQESVNDPLPETYSEADLFKPKNKDTLPDIPSKHINLSERGIIQFPENEIEGTRETIDDGDNIYPYLNGFTFLGKAATVLQNDENALADIYYKMGEITELEDRFLPAMNFYKKSVFFRPDNANYKMKFADNAIACFFYRDALAQLDSLAVQNQIGIRHRLIRADFLMLAGRLAESDTALQQLARFTDSVFAVTPYQLKLAFIQNANKNAIQIAAAELKKDPGNNLLPYLIANLYAKQNKNKEALEWLKKAIDKGFNLGFVVKYDPVWDKMKNNDRWQGIVKMMKPLVYKSTNQVQGN